MTKEYLTYHYTVLGKTTREIAKDFGCGHLVVLRKLHSYGIQTRGIGPRAKEVNVKCDYCSKPLKRNPSTKSKNNFCNYEHYHLWMIGNTQGENSNNWKGGITAISSENLKTPQFRNLKRVVLSQYPICVICGDDKHLHVHHIKTRREYPELCFEQKNLITLCRSCHSSIKGKEKEWEGYFVGLVEKDGELLEHPNVKDEGNQHPSQSNVRSLVDWKVQRLMGEESQTNNPDTSAVPEREDIVRTA